MDGSLCLSKLGAEVQGAPQLHPESRYQLDVTNPPQLVLIPGSWQRAGKRQGGRMLGRGKGLNSLVTGLPDPSSPR